MHRNKRWMCAGVAVALVAYAEGEPGAAVVWPAGGVRVSTEPWQSHRDVLPDGDGGAWVATTALHARVQHLAADGSRLWGGSGSVLSVAATESPLHVGIVPDSQGGVIAGWTERREGWNPRVFVQRLDASGTPLWDGGAGDPNGVVLTTATPYVGSAYLQIAPDGADGAVLAWGWGGLTLRVQRVNASGVPLWEQYGTTLTAARWTLWDMDLVPDGSGGAFVAWVDRPENGDGAIVYVTRVDGTGARPAGWPPQNTVLCDAPGARDRLVIVPDGSSGVFVFWSDHRDVADDPPLYGHHVLADGTLPWGANDGRKLVDRTNNEALFAAYVVPDGAGGFVAAWQLGSGAGNDTQLQAQRFDADGDALWNAGSPVWLCNGPSAQVDPRLAPDGAGGAFAVWRDYRNGSAVSGDSEIRAQHLAGDGTTVWTGGADGVVVSQPVQDDPSDPRCVADGAGGLVAVWMPIEGAEAANALAQRVAPSEDGDDAVSQFLLVTKVSSAPNAKKPEKSRLSLTATLDTGGTPATFTGPARVTIGAFDSGDVTLVADKKGVLRHRSDVLDVALVPSPAGSSRCALTVKVRGVPAASAPRDGRLDVGFRCGNVDTEGACILANGRSAWGGPMTGGPILPASAQATFLATGTTNFSAGFVFAPEPSVSVLGDVAFVFGAGNEFIVPAASFRKHPKRAVFTFTGAPGSLPAMTIDFLKGKASVAGKKIALGAFPEGPQTVRFTIGSVGTTSSTDVRMVRTGAKLRY